MRYKIVKIDGKKSQRRREKRSVDGKTLAKKLRQACGVVCLAVFVFCVAVFVLPLLPKRPVSADKTEYGGVLQMWNVESFEGGCGSRQNWLTKRAAKFERANKGTYVHVETITPAQAEDRLSRGETFDIVGFSFGSGALFCDKLLPVAVPHNVADNFKQSATYGSSTYAIPYLSGVYCLFARQSELAEEDLPSQCLTKRITRKVGKRVYELQPLTYGVSYYNNPLYALALSGVRGSAELSELTQYGAYEGFVAHTSAVTLLGTQRDLYRLNKRTEQGKIEPLAVLPLGGYTDLVQYVGISDGANKAAAEAFCKYLLSAEAQSSLVDIGMFSVTDSIYSDQIYKRCEVALAECYVPNVFTVDAASLRRQAAKLLEGKIE